MRYSCIDDAAAAVLLQTQGRSLGVDNTEKRERNLGVVHTVVTRSIAGLMWLLKGDEARVHPIICTIMNIICILQHLFFIRRSLL